VSEALELVGDHRSTHGRSIRSLDLGMESLPLRSCSTNRNRAALQPLPPSVYRGSLFFVHADS
jgi:hypothetical protein